MQRAIVYERAATQKAWLTHELHKMYAGSMHSLTKVKGTAPYRLFHPVDGTKSPLSSLIEVNKEHSKKKRVFYCQGERDRVLAVSILRDLKENTGVKKEDRR